MKSINLLLELPRQFRSYSYSNVNSLVAKQTRSESAGVDLDMPEIGYLTVGAPSTNQTASKTNAANPLAGGGNMMLTKVMTTVVAIALALL